MWVWWAYLTSSLRTSLRSAAEPPRIFTLRGFLRAAFEVVPETGLVAPFVSGLTYLSQSSERLVQSSGSGLGLGVRDGAAVPVGSGTDADGSGSGSAEGSNDVGVGVDAVEDVGIGLASSAWPVMAGNRARASAISVDRTAERRRS